MRRRGVGFGVGVVAAVIAAGLLSAQAPSPAGSSPAAAPQGTPPAAQTPPPQPPAPAPSAPAPASQPSQRPSFRGGVDVVSLNVTVTDQSRNFVTSLEQGDFVVFEDGVKQDVTLSLIHI